MYIPKVTSDLVSIESCLEMGKQSPEHDCGCSSPLSKQLLQPSFFFFLLVHCNLVPFTKPTFSQTIEDQGNIDCKDFEATSLIFYNSGLVSALNGRIPKN